MSASDAESVIVTLLDAITSPLALDAGRNLFLSPPLDPSTGVPLTGVFVLGTGGGQNDRLCGSHDHQRSSVQVTVRVDGSDYAGGKGLVRACWAAVHCAIVAGWYSITVREPDPYYVGPGRTKSGSLIHTWTFNAECGRVA